jgi:hypothetical protein
VRLRSEAQESGWSRQPRTVAGADGSFRFEPVVVGRYRVTAQADGYSEASSDGFELHALELHSGVALRLPKALVVSGRITLQGVQTPPRFVRLVATRVQGSGSASASVNSDDMSFRFENLGPGTWNVHVASDLDVEFVPQTIELTRDVTDLQLDFESKPEEQPEAPAPFVYEAY